MDNRKRPLQDYFNAARNRPGLSEEEIRAIVGQGMSEGTPSLAPSRRRRILTFGGAIFTLAALSAGIFRMGSSIPDAAVAPVPAAASRQMRGATAPMTVPGGEEMRAGSRIAPTAPIPTLHTSGSHANSSYDQETSRMMKRTATMKLAATGAALLGAATMNASAQGSRDAAREREPKELPAVVQQMQSELGLAASDYWTLRLNDYKVRIDRSLSPEDLAELNRLRVRFNVLAVQLLGRTIGADGAAADGAAIEEQQRQGLEQLIEIYKKAQSMAPRYRSDLDAIAATVVDDVEQFIPEMNRRADTFMELRRAEIDRAGIAAKISSARAKTEEVAAMLGSSQGKSAAKMLYTFALEPVVMLYDGTDLSTLLRQMEQVSSGGKGFSLSSGAIAGYTLPDHTVLKPNTPNPASSSVTIGYSLPEPSQQTTLRLYDAQGTLVRTYDEGARGAGEHDVHADVSGLAAGTYLYHLTVRTSGGDRVYSRTMQVVR